MTFRPRHYMPFVFAVLAGTACVQQQKGSSSERSGSVTGEPVAASSRSSPYDRPGFATIVEDGRLWVFRSQSPELAAFLRDGELVKHVSFIAVGPAGMTVRGTDRESVLEYLAMKPGFEVRIVDGRLWLFVKGSPELEQFESDGELAKHVTLIGAGALGSTVKTPDRSVFQAYEATKQGFVARARDGRLWIFREGSEALEKFDRGLELAKHVTRVSAGPGGVTLKAPDSAILDEYLVARDGFETIIDEDRRLWVFHAGSDELQAVRDGDFPEKHVTLVGAGPLGMTVKALDRETARLYLESH